jgi:predicted metal-binding protein
MRVVEGHRPAHVLVCCAEREGGIPACGRRGREVFLALQADFDRANAADDVQVVACGCLGACARDRVVVAVPSRGRTWCAVALEDVRTLVTEVLGECR